MQRLTLGKDHEGGKMSIFLKLTLFGGDSAAAAASESAGDTGISPDGGELREAEAAESASKGTEKAEPKDRGADFEKLISGDYKEAFQSKVQSIIDRRFKETKNLEAAVGGMSPIIERLSARYGTKSGDFAARRGQRHVGAACRRRGTHRGAVQGKREAQKRKCTVQANG